jgi:endoglucanase
VKTEKNPFTRHPVESIYHWFFVVILSIFFYAISPVNAATPWLHTDANKIKDPAGNVVVLRGVDSIDLGAMEAWYGGVIALIDRVTNKSDPCGSYVGWYPRVIRLAVYPFDEGAFSGIYTFTPGYDDYYETLLRPVVDYCKTKDLYAIIEWHYIGNTYMSTHQATTSEFWEYMAPRFAGDSHVLFELFQEPINNTFGSSSANWASVKTDMQTWVNIVRRYAPYNLILVGGPTYCQVIAPQATNPIDGNNIVYVSHIYPGSWTSGNRAQITTCAAVYPVFMTEWGFDINASSSSSHLRGTITSYGQPIMNFVEGLKISSSAWEACSAWEPPMFNWNWTLRIGEGNMGGFVKDTLYLRRNDDQPSEGDNIWPTVSITAPLDGDIFHQGEDIVIEANASDSDGNVTKVEFYCQGDTKLGEDTNAPYSYTWNNAPPGRYCLAARATDNSGATQVSAPAIVGVTSGDATGYILREWWAYLAGSDVNKLTSDVNYPTDPNGRELITRLQGPTKWRDYYGTRIRGYLYPPADGNYTFWIASAARSELWLSTDADPCHSVLIANEPIPPVPSLYEWEKYATQRSSPIPLSASGKYYIEVLHKESVSLDHIEVAWQGPGITQQVIDGVYLSPCYFDYEDLYNFAVQWPKASGCSRANAWCQGADRDRDGKVQFDDFARLVAEWPMGPD